MGDGLTLAEEEDSDVVVVDDDDGEVLLEELFFSTTYVPAVDPVKRMMMTIIIGRAMKPFIYRESLT